MIMAQARGPMSLAPSRLVQPSALMAKSKCASLEDLFDNGWGPDGCVVCEEGEAVACNNTEKGKTRRDKTVASSRRKHSKVAACHNPKTKSKTESKTGVKTAASPKQRRYAVRRAKRWQPT